MMNESFISSTATPGARASMVTERNVRRCPEVRVLRFRQAGGDSRRRDRTDEGNGGLLAIATSAPHRLQAHDPQPPPHASRPRSVPPMNPPAPCTVTLPAHRPHASHRRPRHSACRCPAEPCLEFQPAPCATIHVSAHRAPEGLAQGARRDEPRSSFACPRLSTSPIQPCPSPLAYVAPHRSIEPGGVPPGAAAGATQRPRCARPGRHRCKRSSHGARRVGLPFGPASALRPPSCRKGVLRAGRVCAHAVRGCGAPRVIRRSPASLRSHRAASGSGCRLRLALAAARSSRSFCLPRARGGVPILPPSCHSTRLALTMSPTARLRRGKARIARAGDEQGRSPALPRNSPPREELRCALRLPAVAESMTGFAPVRQWAFSDTFGHRARVILRDYENSTDRPASF
jgi:hypothetical protein